MTIAKPALGSLPPISPGGSVADRVEAHQQVLDAEERLPQTTIQQDQTQRYAEERQARAAHEALPAATTARRCPLCQSLHFRRVDRLANAIYCCDTCNAEFSVSPHSSDGCS